MKKIGTITINPAFDLHYFVPGFRAGQENLVERSIVEAGGKGVNTSRALVANGVPNVAYLILGEANGTEFLEQLKRDGLNCRTVMTPGRIRENLTVHPDEGKETRISVNSFEVTEEALAKLEREIFAENLSEEVIVFSGRLPKGISKPRAKKLLAELIRGGAKTAMDSSSFDKQDLLEIRPWLIKPNEQEIVAFLGTAPASLPEAAAAARKLVLDGISETVMITLGGDGAVWSDGKDTCILNIPRLENPVSTIGAGDSTIGGMLAGAAKGLPTDEMLRLAVSYGTAACMTEGTKPPRPEDVQRVFAQVRTSWI